MDLYLGQHLTILPTQTNNYYLSCLLESLRYFWFISHGVNTLWLLCCFDDSEHKLRCVHAFTRVWLTKNKTSVFLQGPFLYHNLTNTSTNKSATLKKHIFLLFCVLVEIISSTAAISCKYVPSLMQSIACGFSSPQKRFFFCPSEVDQQLMRSW